MEMDYDYELLMNLTNGLNTTLPYDYIIYDTYPLDHPQCQPSNFTSSIIPGYNLCIQILLPIICSFGVLGILLTVIVLSHKNMSTSTNCYLISLAMADFFFLLILFLKCFETRFDHYGYLYYMVVVYYAYIVLDIFLLASVWLTVMLAVERYIAICHSLRAINICTVTRARIIIVLIYFSAVCIKTPNFFREHVTYYMHPCIHKTVPHMYNTDLGNNETFRDVYRWIDNTLVVIIPFLLLLVLNGCLIREIHRSTNYLRYHLASDSNVQTIITGEEIKITLMLISVIVVFFICQAPYLVLMILKTMHTDELFPYFHQVTYATNLLLLLRSSFNFILYCWFSEKFWYTFKRTFCKTACVMKRAPTWIRSRISNSEHGNSNNNRKISYYNTKETTC